MQLLSEQSIAGISAILIRNYLRRCGQYDISEDQLRKAVGLSGRDAKAVLAMMLAEGYISPKPQPSTSIVFTLTYKGFALANATAARPLLRSTADKLLRGFMERLTTANENPDFLYRTKYVLLFGSMLSDAIRVGDIDLVVEFEAKASGEAWTTWRETRVSLARKAGRHFPTLADEMNWPLMELVLFLKNRSRAFSFHGWGGVDQLPSFRYQVLQGDGEAAHRRIPYGIRFEPGETT